jgi:hypothetical protein
MVPTQPEPPNSATTRVIYRILEKQREVEVIHVRDGAMGEFSTDDPTSGE